MAAALGGLDVVALTGGIGEHNAAVHAGLTERLAWLGTGRTVPVLVLPAREDLQIAAETAQLLGRHGPSHPSAGSRREVR